MKLAVSNRSVTELAVFATYQRQKTMLYSPDTHRTRPHHDLVQPPEFSGLVPKDKRGVFQELPEPNRACLVGVW